MMKKVLLTCLVAASLNGFGQQLKQKFVSMADPSLGRIEITDLSDNVLDASNLSVGKLIKLRIPVSNLGQKDLPAGSCRVKIGLGSKLVLDPNFVLTNAKLNNFFAWSSAMIGGQLQITGDLVAPLPADFNSISVFFRVGGTRVGNSTITANFLVSNHLTENTLSDMDPTNNTSFLAYTMKPSVKGAFTKLDVNKTGCTINVSFSAENEINVRRYEIETSKDNANFVKIGETEARNLLYYNNNFPLTGEIKAPLIYIRIKAIKTDGTFQYSEARSVSGTCEQPWVLNLYPNPVTADVRAVMISAKAGVFEGKYRISVTDVNGKQMQAKEVELNYATQFKYELGVLGAGQYMIQIINADGTQSAVLKFEKL